MVQNAAASLLTNTKKHEHITPVHASLHWLPVQSRIHFKVLLMVYLATHSLAASYIGNMIHHHQVASRSLRSTSQGLLRVPGSKPKQKSDRGFATGGPQLWKKPADVRNAPKIVVLKSRLKTYFFFFYFF